METQTEELYDLRVFNYDTRRWFIDVKGKTESEVAELLQCLNSHASGLSQFKIELTYEDDDELLNPYSFIDVWYFNDGKLVDGVFFPYGNYED